ncbi:YchJ family protein [Pseudarthrobacter sp. J1763]|uniref:YchJ family protein n=1 Tax=Pseudarthrobacter sp. J1763 TaxID=3420445 RepID=UPI003D2E7C44
MKPLADADRCPCNSGDIFAECCGRFLHGTQSAPTAQALMRSRYTAFACGHVEYLMKSWHPSTRPDELELEAGMIWRRLVIEDASAGGPFDTQGTVTFSAYYLLDGQKGVQQELSRFVREDGQWFYLDGVEPRQ